jgi:hypothetical protein
VFGHGNLKDISNMNAIVLRAIVLRVFRVRLLLPNYALTGRPAQQK